MGEQKNSLLDFAPVIGGVVDTAMGFINQGASNRTAKYLARLAYDKQLEQWNRANAYNDPSAQMERLKAAGLNPNLVYGNGSAVGNTTQAGSPRFEPPDIRYNAGVNALGTLNSYMDLRQKQANIDLIKEHVTNQKIQNTIDLMTQTSTITEREAKASEKFYKAGIAEDENYLAGLRRGAIELFGNPYGESISNYFPTLLRLQLKQLATQIASGESGMELHRSEIGKQSAEVEGINIKNDLSRLERDFYEKLGIGGGAIGTIMKALGIPMQAISLFGKLGGKSGSTGSKFGGRYVGSAMGNNYYIKP